MWLLKSTEGDVQSDAATTAVFISVVLGDPQTLHVFARELGGL